MKITKRTVPSSLEEITLFKVENESGASVELSSLGAGIVEVNVPDKDGKIENVALSYANPADYIADGPCLGKVPGRYANRIALGKLNIDGKDYQLAINNGPNALHGGPTGFMNRIWNAEELPDGVRFTYKAADGEEGYPGEFTAVAEYHWSEDNVLTLNLSATTDKETVVNLTNHAYFNLDGADAGTVLTHKMKLNAANWLPTDATQIPTGEIAPVEGTPMDFRDFKEIGKNIKADFEALKIGKGYDHCWVTDGYEKGKMINEVAVLMAPTSGRVLTVGSTQPGMQIYTGNWLSGSPLNKSGKSYEDYEGVAIEMQGFPDAPHHPNFPSQALRPGEEYCETIRFAFSVK
ncbi:MAG: galactose mutarotase [Bacteroides sp.]|nr:galactose mutarotase [Bacteroides sp.]